MGEEVRKAPHIRFKGFTDDWEESKVGDYYEFKNGLNKGKEFFGIGTPIVNFKDVFDNRGIISETLKGKVKLEPSEIKNYEVRKGDLFFTRTSETIEEIGYPSVMLEEVKDTVFSGFVLRGRCFLEDDPLEDLFKKYVFITEKFRVEMLKKSSMTTRALTSGTAIKNMEFFHPSSKKEQKKIGSYFTNLDNSITLHQRKLDLLKVTKKSMLQKMFPKDGANVPEIRFAGFTDAWEQRKVGEFVKNVAKKNKENLDLEPYAVTNDRGFIAQREAHDDFGYMSNVDRSTYNIVPPNSFSYNPARINVGSLGYYAGTKNVIVSSLYEVFQTAEYIDDRFLWHWFKSDYFPNWIEKLQEGSVRLYFYFDKLIQCEIMIPSLEEQKRISMYLDKLDNLITLHQRELDLFKDLKKSMLKQMFI